MIKACLTGYKQFMCPEDVKSMGIFCWYTTKTYTWKYDYPTRTLTLRVVYSDTPDTVDTLVIKEGQYLIGYLNETPKHRLTVLNADIAEILIDEHQQRIELTRENRKLHKQLRIAKYK